MSDYLTTNYNQNKVQDISGPYSNYDAVITNSASQAGKNNYTSTALETKKDTFEGKNGIRTYNSNKRKKGISSSLKWLLGIGGTIAAVGAFVIGHKALATKPSLEIVQKNFSEIFRKNISTEEAQNITKRYREIFEIKDSEEFTRTLFNQVKKDYGYEKANLPLEINYMTGTETLSECMRRRAGGFNSQNCNMVIDLPIIKGGNLSNRNRKDLLDTFYHEFRHMQQTELCYRFNSNKYLEALENNSKKDIGNFDKKIAEFKEILNSKSKLQKYANKINKSIEETKHGLEKIIDGLEKRNELGVILVSGNSIDKNQVKKELERCFKDVPLRENISEFKADIDKFMENSANYLRGEEGMKAYKAQPLESDAHSVGKMARTMYDYIFMK